MRSAVLRGRDTDAATRVTAMELQGARFRVAYVTIELVRGVFMVAAFPAGVMRRNHAHLLAWSRRRAPRGRMPAAAHRQVMA